MGADGSGCRCFPVPASVLCPVIVSFARHRVGSKFSDRIRFFARFFHRDLSGISKETPATSCLHEVKFVFHGLARYRVIIVLNWH